LRILFISARRRNEYAAIGEYYKKLFANPQFVPFTLTLNWNSFHAVGDIAIATSVCEGDSDEEREADPFPRQQPACLEETGRRFMEDLSLHVQRDPSEEVTAVRGRDNVLATCLSRCTTLSHHKPLMMHASFGVRRSVTARVFGLAPVLVAAFPPKFAILVATFGRAIEPLIHSPK
jgi:hypothetical protein